MYSGNNSTSEYPTQWALNPTAYQNIDSTQVDWAALAQQWIHMKETTPFIPAAPPPPPVVEFSHAPAAEQVEAGEAPMDVENQETNAVTVPNISSGQWSSDSTIWGNTGWNQWGLQTGWGWPNADKPEGVPPAQPTVDFDATSDDVIPSYTTGSAPTFVGGYWTSNKEETSPSEIAPAPRNRDHKPHKSHRSSSRTQQRHIPPSVPVVAPTPTLDAAKRRQLPAWIREGLEKMEREKQKQLEQEQLKREQENSDNAYDAIKGFEDDDGNPKLPAKSKFDSDSESEPEKDEKEVDRIPEQVAEPPAKLLPPQKPTQEVVLQKSREEILQDVMLTVRRTLTEILLDVTNDEIHTVSQEELTRHLQASSGGTVGKSQALSAIAGGLGLGIYGESSGSESGSDDESDSTPKRSNKDYVTDAQLQDIIRRRKSEFERTSREIEAAIREEEARLEERTTATQPRPDIQQYGENHQSESSLANSVDVRGERANERESNTPPPAEKRPSKQEVKSAHQNHDIEESTKIKVDSRSKTKHHAERTDKHSNYKKDYESKRERKTDKTKLEKKEKSSKKSLSWESESDSESSNSESNSKSSSSSSKSSDSESSASSSSSTESEEKEMKNLKKDSRSSSYESAMIKSKKRDEKKERSSEIDEGRRKEYSVASSRSSRTKKGDDRSERAQRSHKEKHSYPKRSKSRSRSYDRWSIKSYKKESSYRHERQRDRRSTDRRRERDSYKYKDDSPYSYRERSRGRGRSYGRSSSRGRDRSRDKRDRRRSRSRSHYRKSSYRH